MPKNRLRRVIMKKNTIQLYQNQSNLAKITPKGAKFVGCDFLDQKKKVSDQPNKLLGLLQYFSELSMPSVLMKYL